MKPLPICVLANLLGKAHSSQNLVRGAAIDSRLVKADDVFFALPGQHVDGHAFLSEVAKKHAALAIVHESYHGDPGLPLLHVADVQATLHELAHIMLKKSSSKVIAITGSVGKTTTKEFAKTLLSSNYSVFASPRSYNSQATLPLSILLADGNEDFLILEMGMSEPGQIAKLVKTAPPDVALLTTVALQHVDLFPDGLAGIAREKAAIFSHEKTKLGLIHHEMPFFDMAFKSGSCPKKTFSYLSPEADFYMEMRKGCVIVYPKGDAPIQLHPTLPIKVYHQNLTAAIALARYLEVPWSLIQEAVYSLKLPAMRFEKVELSGITFINDAYNANPDAMKAALESLPKPKAGGKTIAVLGEMNALGIYAEGGHASVAQSALNYADLLLSLGGHCLTMKRIWDENKKPAEHFENRSSLEEYLIKVAKPGDVVLLKGSRALALDEVLKRF